MHNLERYFKECLVRTIFFAFLLVAFNVVSCTKIARDNPLDANSLDPAQPLLKPIGVHKVTSSTTQIIIAWNSVQDAQFYSVYKQRTGVVLNNPIQKFDNIQGTQFIDNSDLIPNVSYTYEVSAHNNDGRASVKSDPIQVLAQ
jgi:hypothetical protein